MVYRNSGKAFHEATVTKTVEFKELLLKELKAFSQYSEVFEGGFLRIFVCWHLPLRSKLVLLDLLIRNERIKINQLLVELQLDHLSVVV